MLIVGKFLISYNFQKLSIMTRYLTVRIYIYTVIVFTNIKVLEHLD